MQAGAIPDVRPEPTARPWATYEAQFGREGQDAWVGTELGTSGRKSLAHSLVHLAIEHMCNMLIA